MNFDKILSLVTMGALAGLVVLNADKASQLIAAVSAGASNYITALQGRGGNGG